MRRDLDLAVAAMLAVLCAVGGAVPWLRIPAGLLLVLVLPGYPLSTLLVPARGTISPLLWRATWTAGLSLAVAVLGGLALNLTPAGLTRFSWTISIAAVTLLAAAGDAWRRRRSHQPQIRRLPRWSPVTRLITGYALAATVIAGGGIGLAVASAAPRHPAGFAQLWFVPANGAATLGVRSAFGGPRMFEVTLRGGSGPISGWAFSLGPGQTWQETIAAPAGQRLTAELTTGQRTTPQTVTITTP